jgi:hypothetical protein
MSAHSKRAHAKLSPSSAHRWFQCPGSINASVGIEQKSSDFADEGTAAPELAQWCLQEGAAAVDFPFEHVAVNNKKYEVTEEMADGVQLYVDECRKFMGDEWEYEIEAKLDLRHIPGMEFGTGDFVAYNPNELLLLIRDLKYGKGVPVDVKNNEQLLVYAEGTAKRFHNRGLDRIDLGIVQPRCPHKDGPIRTCTIDAVDLVEFRFVLTDAAKATEADNAPLLPGDWCKWCPAAVTCEARRKRNVDVAEMEFGMPAEVSTLAPEKMAEIMLEASALKDWIKRVEERAHEMAREQGLPGFKFVRSTSHRKWKDDAEAAKYLVRILELDEDAIYTEPKLRSPAQVEKLLGAKRKKEIEAQVHKPPGKIILVPEGDPRESVKPDAESEFA